MAFVGAERVDARSVVANVRVALALVDVNARITTGSQRVAAAAYALERSLEVVTLTVVADAGPITTFVDI